MEKPAVVFSEEGFKMFTDLIRDLTMAQGAKQLDAFNKDDADALVKEYFKREDRPELVPAEIEPPAPKTLYDMDEVALVVATELSENIGTEYDSSMISTLLNEHDYEYTPKGAISVMRGTMKRFPSIVRVEKGLYAWREDEQQL